MNYEEKEPEKKDPEQLETLAGGKAQENDPVRLMKIIGIDLGNGNTVQD